MKLNLSTIGMILYLIDQVLHVFMKFFGRGDSNEDA